MHQHSAHPSATKLHQTPRLIRASIHPSKHDTKETKLRSHNIGEAKALGCRAIAGLQGQARVGACQALAAVLDGGCVWVVLPPAAQGVACAKEDPGAAPRVDAQVPHVANLFVRREPERLLSSVD